MSRGYDAGPRARTNNFFDVGVVGRRTGITMKANVKKDDDGLDNIDDFWQDDDAVSDDNYGHEDDYEDMQPSRTQLQQPRHYVEQELPEELLSTPTSRRARIVPMSRGSGSSGAGTARGLSIPGSSAYDNLTEEYQSPSFHAVKKRLVFTHDSSDVEPDQEDIDYRSQPAPQQRSMQQRKGVSGSPALDRLLNATTEKSVMKARAAAAPPILAAGTNKPRAAANTASSRRPIDQGPPATMKSRRSLGIPKAFDFGGDVGLTDEADYGSDDDNDEPYRTPPQATKTTAKTITRNMARTPAEFKRVSKIAAAMPTTHADPEDRYGHDDRSYHEAEPRDEDDDRLRFSDSDEERAGRYADQYDDEDEDQHQDLSRHRQAIEPVQQKRTASAKSSQTASRRKIPAETIASSSSNLPKKQPASKKKVEKATSPRRKAAAVTEQTDDDQDEGEVPSSQLSSRKADKSKASTATKAHSKAIEARRHYESAQELVLEEVPVVPEVATEETGVRRSHRTKIAPLEFWKNERVVLGRNDDVAVSVPVIKGILRAAPQEPQSLSNKKRRRAGTNGSSGTKKPISAPRTRRAARKTDHDDESDEYDEDLEKDRAALELQGAREETDRLTAETIDHGTNKVIPRVIAESAHAVRFRDVEGGEYQFHRGLEDIDSVVSGTMKIKRGGKKPSKNGSPCSMVFYIIRGLVRVTVHESEFVLSTGGRFLVPRGNRYSITNLSRNECRLFFVQSKAGMTAADSGITS
ncbi:hypothetical protein BGZ70_010670 [Mortierella alpina]|uniref:Mif2/CENP-C cupin domain-containing protein n=1 Tax=Mortierella alpina TaxID=64518 RepID=A0A9P6IYP0_MORAP|nr:hypothetical protein BGZ70_010670 [Mortierella alpina]